MFDGKAFGAEIVGIVKGHVERSLAPLPARLDAIEKMIAALPAPKDGKDGKDADVDEIAALAAAALLPDIEQVRSMVKALPATPDVPAMIAEAIAGLPVPKDGEPGKSITLEDVAPMIQAEIAKAVDDIPRAIAQTAEDAIESIPPAPAGKDADPELIRQMVVDAVAALPPTENGKDADPVEVAAQIAQEVERAVAALPVPKDGQSVTLDDVRPLIDEAVTKAVTLIPVPKDGADGKDGRDGLDAVKFFRDASGHLIVVKSDGSTDDLGEYVGKDGAPGERGKDGADAVGFDDMDLVETERGIFLRFTRGDVVKDFRLPIVTDRGVFKEGTEYHKGDGVTWGGSFWIAQDTTADKPDSGKGWRLSVKRGRDGKDGTMKPAPKPGPVKVG